MLRAPATYALPQAPIVTADPVIGTTAVAGVVDQSELADDAGDDLVEVRDQAADWLSQAVNSLPRIGIAVLVVLVAWLISIAVRRLLAHRWRRRRTPSFAEVMPRLVGWTIFGLGVTFGITVAFPSIDPVDVIAGLGVASIAAGFAFQDVLSNLLSGLLLITRQPFVAGDQIQVGDHEGAVEGITIRETAITTFQGRRVLIPNRDVYQSAIVIQTAHPAVRTDLTVGCSYGDDLELAASTALHAAQRCDGVLHEPAPEAFFCEFGESSINLELRVWSDPHEVEILHTQHRVVMAVKAAFDEAGLTIPWPIRTLDAGPSLRRLVEQRSDGAAAAQTDRRPPDADQGAS